MVAIFSKKTLRTHAQKLRLKGGETTSKLNKADQPNKAKGPSQPADSGLADLAARCPPLNEMPEQAFHQRYMPRARLSKDAAAGGGLITGEDGQQRPHYWGHRERLRTRFLKGGHDAMPDYEILELILFNAIPRIEVKPLAKRLLAAFGDLSGIVAASEHRILKVEGATSKVYLQLRIAEAFAARMSKGKILNRNLFSSWKAVINYCRTSMAHRETEQFRILFLDTQNVLIADEEQARGTVDHVPVYPREVAKRALELNAQSLILIHNHPSGDTTPSHSDIKMTRQIRVACETIGVEIHDHIIIGKSSETSFKSKALL